KCATVLLPNTFMGDEMSRAKDRGTRAETAVVHTLRAAGFVHAERRALNGNQDRGDIAGIPGLVIEVKNHARLALAEWAAEMETERDRDGARYGVVRHKRRGHTNPHDWYVTITGSDFLRLLAD